MERILCAVSRTTESAPDDYKLELRTRQTVMEEASGFSRIFNTNAASFAVQVNFLPKYNMQGIFLCYVLLVKQDNKEIEMTIYWLYLLIAGFCEIGFVIGVKLADGFTKPLWSVATIAVMLLSLFFMSMSLKGIPMGTGYAIWTSIGTVGAVMVSILFFQEPVNGVKIICVIMIVGGIVGLKLAAPTA